MNIYFRAKIIIKLNQMAELDFNTGDIIEPLYRIINVDNVMYATAAILFTK
jgi:hypothetical protein